MTTETEATKQAARTAIRKIAGTYDVAFTDILFAQVTAVDMAARTCDVKAITGKADTEMKDVNLQSDKSDGELKVPALNSTVVIAHSNTTDPFVILWSDIDEISWKGGNFGGLTKTQELKSQIDKLNSQLQAVISSLQNWTVVPNDGGSALKAYFAAQIAGKIQGDFSNIENTTIKHGDK